MELLPQARAKFVAVAGQEAFIADSADAAWRLARAAHAEDDGNISQYDFPQGGLRIYCQSVIPSMPLQRGNASGRLTSSRFAVASGDLS